FGGGLTMASFDAGSRVRVGRMSTAEDVMSGVGQWARALLAGPPSEKHDAAMRPVYNWILATGDKAIGERREMLFRGLRPAPRAALSPAIAGRYFPAGKPLRLSITQLEQFAACPLQYFYHYQLNLSPREELSLDALGLGELQHNILEGLYRRIIREEFGWPHHDVELLHAALVEETDRAVGELHAELSQSTPGYGKTRRRILRALSHTVEADRRRASAGAMRPESVELFFGTTERRDGNGRVVALPVLPIPTPAGRQLQIWGKIDRLDKSDDGERTVLFDYKSSWRAADINHIFYGLSLQLPVYVLVAQRVAQLDPVGAFYVGLAQRRESREGPDASISPVNDGFYQRSKPRGFANAAAAFALDANLQPEDDGLTGRGWSDWYPLGFKRDGDIRKACDLLSVEDFATLLAYTAQKIAALADRLASGEIAPLPYKDRQDTPCIRCHFRAMCSFDPSRDPFRIIARRKKADLFRLMQEKC
ncbi:MAG TPA: PD-(D/E)XK nuclease family protein, partial [Phycisphaerae bacterium]|nr:PD-(D/E)XK nuclease family protein [Phycisphaerae bacterium]